MMVISGDGKEEDLEPFIKLGPSMFQKRGISTIYFPPYPDLCLFNFFFFVF